MIIRTIKTRTAKCAITKPNKLDRIKWSLIKKEKERERERERDEEEEEWMAFQGFQES